MSYEPIGQRVPNEEARVSEYVHAHEVGENVVALYTPIEHQIAFVPTAVATSLRQERIAEIPAQFLVDLMSRGFVVGPDFDAHALDRYASRPVNGFMSLFLVTTRACNMGCAYCVVRGDPQHQSLPVVEQPGAVMRQEVGDAALRLLENSLRTHRHPVAKVTFYGGEPLLNQALLTHLVPRIRELHWAGQRAPVETLCFTNGLLFDKAVASLFREHDVAVGLSLDGDRECHDAARKDAGGQGTYDRVIETYHRYRECGVRVGLSCTIGTHNQHKLLRIAQQFLRELRPLSVQLQTPIQTKSGDNPSYADMRVAARGAFSAFETLRDAGIVEGLAMRRLDPFTRGAFHHRDCLAVGGELAVSPDGRIGPCHNAIALDEANFVGNVLDPTCDPERLPLFSEWHTRCPINMTACRGCPFIALCGGGCPYNALLARGSIWELDPQICGYMEAFVDWLLEDVWKRYAALHFRRTDAPEPRVFATLRAVEGG